MRRQLDLPFRAKADSTSVQELVSLALNGEIRVPEFQRGLRWEASDVVAFFDSLYKGYPVGSLLLHADSADAAIVRLGPIEIDAPRTARALWVVDGQQRVTALAASLGRHVPIPSAAADPFVVYFDAATREFHSPPRKSEIPSTWVPLPRLLDASQLSEWIYQWEHRDDEKLRAAVFEAGTRIREYKLPHYIVKTDDERVLPEIFFRINKTGKPLDWTDVQAALYGGERESPSTLAELADELTDVKMGRPRETEELLPSMLAVQNLDVTRPLGEHIKRDQEQLRTAVSEALGPLRRALLFLRRDAQIPHLRLLPRASPLVVLARFFAAHPSPNKRTVRLLARFVWRALLGRPLLEDRTFRRQGVAAVIDADAEQSTQKLLALVSHERPSGFECPTSFDARSAESRVALLGLVSLSPRDLVSGEVLDVSAVIEAAERHPFRKILDTGDLHTSAANRIVLPGKGRAERELRSALESGVKDEVLRSHAISADAVQALERDDFDSFIKVRERLLAAAVDALGQRLAAWEANDRPTIEYILRTSEEGNESVV